MAACCIDWHLLSIAGLNDTLNDEVAHASVARVWPNDDGPDLPSEATL